MCTKVFHKNSDSCLSFWSYLVPRLSPFNEIFSMYFPSVERRRRDRINTWISELYKLLPPDEQAKSQYQSKGVVLKRVCEYFQNVDSMLKAANAAVEQVSKQIHLKFRGPYLVLSHPKFRVTIPRAVGPSGHSPSLFNYIHAPNVQQEIDCKHSGLPFTYGLRLLLYLGGNRLSNLFNAVVISE